jgi:hypothetical protein
MGSVEKPKNYIDASQSNFVNFFLVNLICGKL